MKKIRKEGREATFVHFRYERLGLFCYYSGLLGHTEELYGKLFKVEDDNCWHAWGLNFALIFILRPRVMVHDISGKHRNAKVFKDQKWSKEDIMA
ncbi:hypothetical protein JHK87_035479 [Glycine soja]|nr:hypothetical protein JHK87_035479 [Glycine soja]